MIRKFVTWHKGLSTGKYLFVSFLEWGLYWFVAWLLLYEVIFGGEEKTLSDYIIFSFIMGFTNAVTYNWPRVRSLFRRPGEREKPTEL